MKPTSRYNRTGLRLRSVAREFFKLRTSQKHDLAQSLNLIEDEDFKKDNFTREKIWVTRADSLGRLGELSRLIDIQLSEDSPKEETSEKVYEPSDHEVQFMQCLMDRFGEDGNLVNLNDWPGFMEIVKRFYTPINQVQGVGEIVSEAIQLLSIDCKMPDADPYPLRAKRILDSLVAMTSRIASKQKDRAVV